MAVALGGVQTRQFENTYTLMPIELHSFTKQSTFSIRCVLPMMSDKSVMIPVTGHRWLPIDHRF